MAISDAEAFDGKYGVLAPKPYSGPCPTTLVFRAEFYLNKPAEIDFTWTRSDGVEVAGEHLTLVEEQPKMFAARSTLNWEVSTEEPKGQSFSVSVTPSDSQRGQKSRAAHVVCLNQNTGIESTDLDQSDQDEGSTERSNSNDAGQWDLGDVDGTEISLGDTEQTDAPNDAPAQSDAKRGMANPQIFKCPPEVEIGPERLPSGWSSGWNRYVIPFKIQTVAANKMTCLYQKMPFTVPVNLAVPTLAKECSPSGSGFVCTMYKQ